MQELKRIKVKESDVPKLTREQESYIVSALYEEAQKFLAKHFPSVPLTIPIELNGRLRTTLGYFQETTRNGKIEALRITISKQMLQYGTYMEDLQTAINRVLPTLHHELVHFALLQLGLPNDDGDPTFENELARVGAPSSGTTKRNKVSVEPLVYYRLLDEWNNGKLYIHNKRNKRMQGFAGHVIVLRIC